MLKTYTKETWFSMAKNLYDLIISEADNITDSDLPAIYPKIVIMYEFFRLIRGEAFYSARPYGIGEYQDEIYKMEHSILEKLKKLNNKLDSTNNNTTYQLDLMKKSFNLKNFKEDD